MNSARTERQNHLDGWRVGLDVVVDNRVRLLTAALLLTGLPDREQRKHPHKVHPLAEAAARELDHLRMHPCVRTIRTNLWTTTAPAWRSLADDLGRVLAEHDLAGFLELFWGDTGRGFVVLPNPLAPRLNWIGLYAPEAHYAVLPPPLIPPDSPEPVASASRPVPTRSTACHELSHGPQFHARQRTSGLEPAIAEVMPRTPTSETFRKSHPGAVWLFSEVLLRAVQVLYLRHNEGEEAAASLVRRFGEREGLSTLMAWVDQLEPYLEGRRAGRYRGWDDYLPIFLTALQT